MQVKGLADITGANSGANHGGASLTGGSKDEGTDYGDRDTGGEESTPPSPPSGCLEGNSDGGGSLHDTPSKKKRVRTHLGMEASIGKTIEISVCLFLKEFVSMFDYLKHLNFLS